MVKWEDVRSEFEPDGALRDIYVTDADTQLWDRALEFLLRDAGSRYSIDEVDAPLPAKASDALRLWPDRAPLLIVEREGIEYACHFFTPDAVELDFWPEDVRGPDEFAALTRFVVGLGRVTSRVVLVTYESSTAAEIFRYSPENDGTEAGPLASPRTRR
jgi:hypothetical protein